MKINTDKADRLIAASLLDTYQDIAYMNTDTTVPMYSQDAKENARKVRKLLKALRRVHNYYTPVSQHI